MIKYLFIVCACLGIVWADPFTLTPKEEETINIISTYPFQRIYMAAHNHSNEFAFFMLGITYMVPADMRYQNFAYAYEYFASAASLGCSPAMYFLSEMYSYGKGIKQDIYMATVYLELAVEYGHDELKNELDLIIKATHPPIREKESELFNIKKAIIEQNLKNRAMNKDKGSFFARVKFVTKDDFQMNWEK